MDREHIFNSIKSELPSLYRYAELSYSSVLYLIFGIHTINGGAEHADPIGQLFGVAIKHLFHNLKTLFAEWYLDNGTIDSPAGAAALVLTRIIDQAGRPAIKCR